MTYTGTAKMRHRIVSITGIGNVEPPLLNNEGQVNTEFADATIAEYFSNEEGFDFQISSEMVNVGIEPAYQYERLKIISINKNKNKSFIQQGRAWGPYGTQIAKTTKT